MAKPARPDSEFFWNVVRISIIIPTLNESEFLARTLRALQGPRVQIIVVDGGSTDETRAVARYFTPHVMMGKQGRGIQQHLGAKRANGDVFIFLHADTLLPPDYCRHVSRIFRAPDVVFGAFRLVIDSKRPILRLIAFLANLRSALFDLPYGDQAIFVRKEAYTAVGGFRHWPLMEDVDLVRRLNSIGAFKLAKAHVVTAPRRWEQENAVRTTLRNWRLMVLYKLGVSPFRLVREYPDSR